MRLPRRHRVLSGVAIGIAVIALLLALAQDQHTLRIKSAVSADDPTSPQYLAALVGARTTSGNAYTVLANGDAIFPAMLAAIDNARERISLETYIFKKGTVADQFTAALEKAARRGVRVSIVVDTFGSSSMDDEHVERLRAAGCDVATFNPPRWYSLEEVNYRTHRKILVVDGEIGFTGGVGVADYWLGNAEGPKHWRDTQVRMMGPVARIMEAAFYEDRIEAGGVVTPDLGGRPVATTGENQDDSTPPSSSLRASDDRAIVVKSSASGGANDLKRMYLLLIGSARRSLDIASPYFLTDESTLWSLEDARKRGVKVRLLLEGDETDAMPVKYASRGGYEALLDLGIELYEFQPTMMHAKVLVVDGVWSMVGSANFDNRSFELNDEMNVAVRDPMLAASLLEDFNEDLPRAHRITADEWRRRPLLGKTREAFWSWFGEIF